MGFVDNDDGTVQKKQLVILTSKKAEVIQQLDDSTTGGHLGVKKTLKKVNLKDDVYYWC